MAVCEEGQDYIDTARTDFAAASARIMDSIRENLYANADFCNPSQNIDIHFMNSGRSLRVDSFHRVIELEEEDLLELEGYRYPPGSLRGVYKPDYGKVVLNKRLWCIETIFHELLHSTSVTSQNNHLYAQYHDFFEGLTELYTGYVMKQVVPFSYETCWRGDKKSRCHCTYQRDVKIWLGLCHFIPFEYTYPLYFKTDDGRWVDKWYAFIERIRGCGFSRFGNVIDEDRKPKWLSLHQECAKNFGREYMDIYNDIRNPLDLNLIRLHQ